MRRGLLLGLLCLTALAFASCSSLGYYWQAMRGQLEIATSQRPITQWLAQEKLDSTTRAHLLLATQIRDFASTQLALPNNQSYRHYADLQRGFVLWNVFAAPEFSSELKESCFPVAGCVQYRGFFEQGAAQAHADAMRVQGYDVYVGGVPAYSTLGWFDDPLLNTFLRYPETELARLLFHELAHQVVYVKDDSMFNESFATAVEEFGITRWIATRGSPELQAELDRGNERRRAFRALIGHYRTQLTSLYERGLNDDVKRARKREIFVALKKDYRALVESWGESPSRSAWLKDELNNAHLASVATYTELVPAFRALLARHHGDLRAFYADVNTLARSSKAQRLIVLQQLQSRSEVETAGTPPHADTTLATH